MGRMKQKGKAGAARAYVTRTVAIKKLQCTLADFRRLCILKGIFPREPRNKKRANKGSSALTSFYYAKDIAYLAHEPILGKFREHKAFAKKLARALGRGEWSTAKSLEESKPVYRLDHIIKERYPTFLDAIRDIDDALCMVSLFASLPAHHRISPSLIEECSRLCVEWHLFVMHTHSLRKVFLSIKGVYYQAEIMDQDVTWLVPYQFTQTIPPDVDVRVMLSFLELYRTLLGFVFFKLYTDSGLVYPPPLDVHKDQDAAGFGAYSLKEMSRSIPSPVSTGDPSRNGISISSKDVRQTIKSIVAEDAQPADAEIAALTDDAVANNVEEEFTHRPSTKDPKDSTSLPTLQDISALPSSSKATLFSPYTFFLSRETSRLVFQFIIRAFGGRVGWPSSSGVGSPFDESDSSITHVIIDRPVLKKPQDTEEERQRRFQRKYVQPQWVVDCINVGKILLEEPYAQGQVLPPHLSPFGERDGAYEPGLGTVVPDAEGEASTEAEEDEEEQDEEIKMNKEQTRILRAALDTAADDPEALRNAELAAEAAGVDIGIFQNEVSKPRKKTRANFEGDAEEGMNKMMMSNKRRKLYDRIKHSKQRTADQRAKLEQRKRDIEKAKRRLPQKNVGT